MKGIYNMKKILIVIDMQNDFVDGALGTPEAQKIAANVIQKIKEYPPENVFATQDTHREDYLETSEGKHLPVTHCIRGSQGWEIIEGIKELILPDHIIEKPTFGSVNLALKLKEMNEQEAIAVELVGVCTDICVVSNALLIKVQLPEVPISIASDCCAGVTPHSHDAAIETMKMCQIEIL